MTTAFIDIARISPGSVERWFREDPWTATHPMFGDEHPDAAAHPESPAPVAEKAPFRAKHLSQRARATQAIIGAAMASYWLGDKAVTA